MGTVPDSNIEVLRGTLDMLTLKALTGGSTHGYAVARWIDGLDKVLHSTWKMARPGRVRVAFGAPLRLAGDDYEALAARVENAVRAL